MNPAVVIKLVGHAGSIKKYGVVALATVAVVLALPILAVFSLGSDVVNFLNASPSAEAAEQGGFYMGGLVPGDTYAWGNCTYWVFAMRYWADEIIPTSWGNANTWDDNAQTDGYTINHTPAVGAIMQTDAGDLGHVAYVTEVNPETGQWKISEMNAPNFNVVSSRTFAANSAIYYNFIHDKKVIGP